MRWLKLASLILMALFYSLAGVAHFTRPDFYLRMMPPYIPFHEAMVFVSGVAEVVLGIALLIPALRVYAAWGVIALLIAVFPANLHMAIANVPFGDPPAPSWWAWARLPLQAVLIAWAWWHTREAAERSSARSQAAAA